MYYFILITTLGQKQKNKKKNNQSHTNTLTNYIIKPWQQYIKCIKSNCSQKGKKKSFFFFCIKYMKQTFGLHLLLRIQIHSPNNNAYNQNPHVFNSLNC